jgi:predicted glycosyltransferase
MKIIFYCQHVLGIGHFFRSLEICRALDEHDVILVTGGPKPDVELAKHIREVRLPGLMMNPDFSELFPPKKSSSMEKVKSDRKKILSDLLESENPDFLLLNYILLGAKHLNLNLILHWNRLKRIAATDAGRFAAFEIFLWKKKILKNMKKESSGTQHEF